MLFEKRFIFFPVRYPGGEWDLPEQSAEEGELFPLIDDCSLRTADGVSLHGWYSRPCRRAGGTQVIHNSNVTLLFLHGNAGNVTHRYEQLCLYACLFVDVFIIDYRGYGKSEGKPSEPGLYHDARAAWDYLTQEEGQAPDRIVLMGKSLGGVAAIDLATQVRPAGAIIESTFTSVPDMAARTMPFIPRLLIRTQLDALEKIDRVTCPKLFVHSPVDEIVPYEHGRRLFDAAHEPKRFHDVPDAGHNDTCFVGGRAYFDAITDFIRDCVGAGGDGAPGDAGT